ncbi:MAG: hypothetical protein LBL82_06155 [Oscillospiraceae bacterium]|jgi:hypothetical protein|nr:hypothetical protein [Oscillospiraceae bacterium]
MSKITEETRRESYEAVKPTIESRQATVLNILKEGGEMTAQEIADELFRRGITPTTERNFVAPRLTELYEQGIVEPVGKKTNMNTRRTVTVWAAVGTEGSENSGEQGNEEAVRERLLQGLVGLFVRSPDRRDHRPGLHHEPTSGTAEKSGSAENTVSRFAAFLRCPYDGKRDSDRACS